MATQEEDAQSEHEVQKRREILRQLERIRASVPVKPGPFPTTEQMLREDRER